MISIFSCKIWKKNRKLIISYRTWSRFRVNHFYRVSKQICIFFFWGYIYIYLKTFETKYVTLHRYSTSNSRERIIFLWLQPSMEIHSSKQGYLFHLCDSICAFLPVKWIPFIKRNHRTSNIRRDGISFHRIR